MAEKKDHTPAYRIFHYYYRCFLPQNYLYDTAFIETFGVPTSGNREIDRELAKSNVLCQVTISEMADYLDQGAVMSLEEPEKSVEIYKTLRDHLVNWQNSVRNDWGGTSPPLEDLRKLDALAAEIYKIAKGFMAEAPSDSKLFRGLEALGKRRGMKRYEGAQEENNLPEEHRSLHDIIAKENFDRRNRWR